MALKHFYALADKDLSRDEVQLGLIEIANKGEAAQPAPVPMTRRTELHGRTPRQVDHLRNIQDFDITFGIGPAGTGKTYLAVASAVDAFERDLVERIILTRPAVEAGRAPGLPARRPGAEGRPYLRPLYDALYDLMGFDRVGKLFERGSIEIAPLAFMRGRTLNNAFIILDEAQNTTPEQMKMFLTRIGFWRQGGGHRRPHPDRPGTRPAQRSWRGARGAGGVRGIAFTEFSKEDVVRHPLVARIVEVQTSRLRA